MSVIFSSDSPLVASDDEYDLIIPYDPGWVFERIAKRIEAYFVGSYRVKAIPAQVFPPPKTKIILLPWWLTYNKKLDKYLETSHARLFTCLYDHFTWKSRIDELKRVMALSSEFFCSNLLLQSEIFEQLDFRAKLLYDGVDTDLFCYQSPVLDRKNIVIGWAGSTAFTHIKRFDLLQQAVEHVNGVELFTINRIQNGIPFEEMPEKFYKNVDVIACCSVSEGTPNPILEGCSSGKAFLSSNVGIVPEIYKETHGGIIVHDYSVRGYILALQKLINSKNLLAGWGEKNRSEVLKNWTWNKKLSILKETLNKYLEGEQEGMLHKDFTKLIHQQSSSLPYKESATQKTSIIPSSPVLSPTKSSKKRILVAYDQEGWSFHRIARWIKSTNEHDNREIIIEPYDRIKTDLKTVDLAVLMWYASLSYFRAQENPHMKILLLKYDEAWHLNDNDNLFGQAISTAAGIVYSCNGMRDRISRFTKKHNNNIKEFVATDGVDTGFFRYSENRSILDQTRPLVIGWTGNNRYPGFDDCKGVEMLKKAISGFSEFKIDISDRNEKRKTHSEMVEWYKTIDVYACLSSYEGTPNPVLEALATGRPVISTNVGVIPEILFNSAQENILTPPVIIAPRSPAQIFSILSRLNQERMNLLLMGLSGRLIVEKYWDWNLKAKKFGEIFDEILKE